jgi:hypothetical protein
MSDDGCRAVFSAPRPGPQRKRPADGQKADVVDLAVALLTARGVDVERELTEARHRHEGDKERARERARYAEEVAVALATAEKKLLAEARGFTANCAGFTASRLREAEARVSRLNAQLTAACCDDPELARTVRRRVA